jgi:dihydroorotate dehydrogenase electron transfer subunit
MVRPPAEGDDVLQTLAEVLANERLNDEHWRLTLAAPGIAETVAPGQFVNVRVSQTHSPLCRRPFSVFRVTGAGRSPAAIEIVYRVVGQGTRLMASARPGHEFDLIGPLGTGYRPDLGKRVQFLVGGGCGAAGLFTLGERLSEAAREQPLELVTVIGFRSQSAVMLEEEFASLGGESIVATDDGTYGRRGSVADVLGDIIEDRGCSADCMVYASGPDQMNQALVRLCRERKISGQIAVEKHMLCGIGGCLTCVCEVEGAGVLKHRDLDSSRIQLDSDSHRGYALVCRDGPVFDMDELVLG